jgi:hypothetical protein
MGARPLLWLLLLRWLHESVCDDKREVMVKEVVLDSAVVDIVYLGTKHECILVTTKSKRLYFSEDSGQNWNEITQKVDSGDVQVERITVNPSDKTVAVLQTQRKGVGLDQKRYPFIYISEDSGRTWRRAWGKKQALHSWIFHPKEKQWALVSWWTGDCDGEVKNKKKPSDDDESPEEKEDKTEREPCSHKLMITRDLGRTFTQIANYVVQFSWGSEKKNQQNRVYFTSYRTKTGDQGRLSLWTKEVDFSYIDVSSRGRPSGKVVEALKHGNKFLVSNEFILVAKVKDDVQQTVWLMVSSDGAKTFKAALLPSGMGELEEKWYTVLDTSEGAVILHINSAAEGTKDTGRIFVSDAAGYKYTQSLVDNVRSAQGECEFDKVVSLQGVYMANVVIPNGGQSSSYKKAAAKQAEDVEKEAADGSEVDKKHGRGGKKAGKPAKEERTIRTVVSFDKGAAWSYLKPPRVDSVGKPYECAGRNAEECSLHLHGTTSWDFYAPFYSIETAVGIIMGTGNVGPTLRFEPEETNTFLSRDGGLTWMEAHKGAFIYEFGDHGGLIVMADDLKKTTEVVFSWNEGQSWYDFRVSKTPFEVDNIITEPNVTATTFVMFGTREAGEGVLYYMKFDSLQFPSCRGVWAADSVSSDYETWTPSDGVSAEKCLLGSQVSYTRRKRTSQCWNGEKFERPVAQKRCSCTQEDYACEIGFVRKLGSQECTFGGHDMMPARFVPASCSKTWLSNAYRKVPGDQCESGWTPGQVEVPCPSTISVSSSKWSLLMILVVGLAFIGYSKVNPGNKGPAANFTWEVSANSRFSFSNPIQPILGGLRWAYAKITRSNEGFGSYGGVTYKKVQGNEFDLDAPGNEESLTDFIDEAHDDDFAPRVYDSLEEKKERESTTVSGGAHKATESVPRLQAPPATGAPPGAAAFDIATGDEELL